MLKLTFVIKSFLISTNYPDHHSHSTQEFGILEKEILVLKPRADTRITGGSIWKKDVYFSLYFTDLTLLKDNVE